MKPRVVIVKSRLGKRYDRFPLLCIFLGTLRALRCLNALALTVHEFDINSVGFEEDQELVFVQSV